MKHQRRTQAERTEASRNALIQAGRRLFADRGYASVGTAEIVAAAGLTRGALYYQFADKTALFVTVLDQVEAEVVQQVARVLDGAGDLGPLARLAASAEAWLEACADPGVQQIVLVDGPAVLGWERWREIGQRHGMGLTTAALHHAMDAGAIPAQPVAPLAHLLVGALDEAALYVSRAPDPTSTRRDIAAVFRRLVYALAAQD